MDKHEITNTELLGAMLYAHENWGLSNSEYSQRFSVDDFNIDLSGADLRGANINWQSHTLIAEILRSAAGGDWQKRSLAGLILISPDWCWEKFMTIDHPDKEWALDELRKWVKDGDDEPDILKKGSK